MSRVWGRRASDQKIACDAFVKKLKSEAVMADRGFVVEEAVAAHGAKLHIPAFLGSKRSQLTGREVTQTRQIDRARIHVGHAIQRIKLFRI